MFNSIGYRNKVLHDNWKPAKLTFLTKFNAKIPTRLKPKSADRPFRPSENNF